MQVTWKCWMPHMICFELDLSRCEAPAVFSNFKQETGGLDSAAYVGTDCCCMDKAFLLHIRHAEYFTHWAGVDVKLQKRVRDSASHVAVIQENYQMTTDEDQPYSFP
ncbi:uncharacterized protein FYN12_015245 [Phoenicopterus ruber ruber]